MNLEELRQKIKQYCHIVDSSESMLAQEIGVHPATLSRKLNGSAQARLTRSDVKQIVRVLVDWEALIYRQDVLEFLELAGLNPQVFTPEEWETPPFDRLEKTLPPGRYEAKPAAPAPLISPAVAPKAAPPPPIATRPVSERVALPRFPTLFIGRAWELVTIKRLLLLPDVRLINLTGTGGVGKTRLALQITAALEEHRIFDDGVCFVALAGVRHTTDLPAAILHALHYEGHTPDLAELISMLRQRKLLLLLDSLEHLPEAGSFISNLLKNAPNLKILVTSRALLKVYGEYELHVPPLTLPASNWGNNPLKLLESEAVALFVERIRAIKPDFELTRENAPLITEICARLDGLPLALELAAGRTRLLNLPNLLTRLTNRLGILTGGQLDLPERQQTLRATIEWSYELLTAPEKKLFRQLAVFAGVFSLEAACAVGDDPLLATELVMALLEKSMLCRIELENSLADSTPELRFEMLETLQEFAWSQLLANGEAGEAIQRQAQFYLQLSQQAEAAADNLRWQWLNQLEKEYPNLQTVLERILATNAAWQNPELALRLSTNLEFFWRQLGYYNQGENWIRQALEQTASLPSERLHSPEFELLRLRAEHVLDWLHFEQANERQAG